MGKLRDAMETIKNNGIYGKVGSDMSGYVNTYNAEPGFIHVPEGTKVFAEVDTRYNVPKKAPKASSELVEKTIKSTEIYRRARLAIMQPQDMSPESRYNMLQAQRKQVAYGIDKYPEPLNADTWSATETVEHIMDESIDRLHYLIMLNIKLEQELLNASQVDHARVQSLSYRIETVIRMIHRSIEEMDYISDMRSEIEMREKREYEACNLTAGMDTDGDGNPIKHSMMHPIQMGPWD